jgi:hypothetical protein
MTKKRENFKRIAEQRVNKVINMIRLVGNLANKRNYDYDDDDAMRIITVIEFELKKAKEAFKKESEITEEKFKL